MITRSPESAKHATELGIPTIFETHDGPGNPKTMRYMALLARAPALVGVVTTSPILKDAFCTAGIDPERIIVRPNAVDLSRFRPTANERAQVRRMLGLEEDAPLVLYTGSFKEYKGIGTVLEAARRLPATRFLLIGGDDESLRVWGERARTLTNVHLMPFVANSELPRYMFAADVCLVPNCASDRTARWTFSLKLYEYLAARRPVVASAIPSLAGILTDGKDALLVPPDDADALAGAIEHLLNHPSIARALGDAGYALVADNTWEARARGILSTLAPDLISH